jgi:itaconate CoA-transferase
VTPRPLDGMLVVALEQAVAAPLASRHLADLGARVVKLERVDGGDFARHYDHAVRGMASHFVWLNRGKESVAIDLKTDAGRDILARLLERADVFLHNLGPGAVDRLGFASAELRARHPRLVICAMSGYGSTGPYRDKRAYDLLVQSETALVAVTGTPDHPAKAGIPVADIASGMYTFANILAALLHRERTGEGAAFEVTMFDALVEWMGHPILATDHTGQAPPRVGLSHPVIAPYDAYPTADGHEVVIGIQNDREWVRLATEVLQRPELATDPDFATNVARVRNRDRVDATVGESIAKLTVDDAVAALDAARIASARLNEVQDLIAHPQLVARDRWRDAPTSAGPVRVLRSPMEPTGEAPTLPVPDLGAHTAAVLTELDYGAADIDTMTAAGAVLCAGSTAGAQPELAP